MDVGQRRFEGFSEGTSGRRSCSVSSPMLLWEVFPLENSQELAAPVEGCVILVGSSFEGSPTPGHLGLIPVCSSELEIIEMLKCSWPCLGRLQKSNNLFNAIWQFGPIFVI